MITAPEMIQKLGKDKFVNFVLNNRDKEKTGAEKERGIKGRVKYRRCQHGVWLIDDYEPKDHCEECFPNLNPDIPYVPKSYEYFNVGTGTFGTNSEHRKYAKSKGLVSTA